MQIESDREKDRERDSDPERKRQKEVWKKKTERGMKERDR